jgi:uncharacterized lipoprotein YddW (UPF0748 family)
MKRIVIFFFFEIFFCYILSAQPKQEIRAVWLTVNYALDWPDNPVRTYSDIQQQQESLDRILDQLKEAHINLVFFQTRIRGNVIYPSKIEPFSEIVKSAYSPVNYDPLAYAVEACHKRGMEFHAWFVVYPLGKNKACLSSTLMNNGSVKKFKDDLYLDPGDPKTNSYLVKLIEEIVSGYDIDGIHLDYIRYPDKSEKFPDNDLYKRYGKGETIANWRRGNINRFVYAAYDAVKTLKPWVQVSSSVVGMYDKISGNDNRHWTAYHSVYQDPADWLKKEKHDFLVPMMYYSGKLFFPFVKDWMDRSAGRYIAPGLGLYRMDKSESDWDTDILIEQIRYLRENNVCGNALFRTRYLTDNKKGIYDEITREFYTAPALLPPLPWLSKQTPDAPEGIYSRKADNYVFLTWDKLEQTEETVFYNLYRSETFPVDTDNPQNLLAVRLRNNTCKIPIDNRIETGYYYAVTCYDRYHNESKACYPVFFVTGDFEK